MSLGRTQRDWNQLADLDPLWAILSDPSQQYGGWELDQFLQTGEEEVEQVLDRGRQLGLPARRGVALDFGCGVGRVTRALSHWFDQCLGIDISVRMVEQARSINHDRPNCEFRANESTTLPGVEDASCDLVYSHIVLQHLPYPRLALQYVEEFMRVLAPGGLAVFQVPSYISLRHRLQVRRRLYAALSVIGVPHDFLYRTLRLNPISMLFVPSGQVVSAVERSGALVVAQDDEPIDNGAIVSTRYYATPQRRS